MRLRLLGKVHPQQGNWNIDGIRTLTFDDATWMIAVRASSVIVVVEAPEPPEFMTFVNELRSIVGGVIDALGFGFAVPLRFEPTHAFKDDHEVMWLHQGWPYLRELEQGAPATDGWMPESELAPVIDAAVKSPLIRHALADVQRAVELPDDTAFYCYRAIESLRLLFLDGDRDAGTARADSWSALREHLALSREELDDIRLMANPRRHGGHRVLTEADRQRCLLLTRRAVRTAIRLADPPELAPKDDAHPG
jgi:hypothetical protein